MAQGFALKADFDQFIEADIAIRTTEPFRDGNQWAKEMIAKIESGKAAKDCWGEHPESDMPMPKESILMTFRIWTMVKFGEALAMSDDAVTDPLVFFLYGVMDGAQPEEVAQIIYGHVEPSA